jgi:hypothetical protein
MADALKAALAEFTQPATQSDSPLNLVSSVKPPATSRPNIESVKLSQLAETKGFNKEKHTPETKDALREALGGLIKEVKTTETPVPKTASPTPSVISANPNRANNNQSSERASSASPQIPTEVPEAVLKQLLGLDTNV